MELITDNPEKLITSMASIQSGEIEMVEEGLIEGDLDYNKLVNGKGIIVNYPKMAKEYNLNLGDKIKLKIFNGKEEKIEEVAPILKGIAQSDNQLGFAQLSDLIKSNEVGIKINKLLAYSLVIIIGVIGFMNLINTMITSIISRKKELGMLQAIGLSNRQLVKILQIEATIYIGLAFIATLIFGNLLGYLGIHEMRSTGAHYLK